MSDPKSESNIQTDSCMCKQYTLFPHICTLACMYTIHCISLHWEHIHFRVKPEFVKAVIPQSLHTIFFFWEGGVRGGRGGGGACTVKK